jgi:ferric-dicitrate binding protein FerR (iron transport regulator)
MTDCFYARAAARLLAEEPLAWTDEPSRSASRTAVVAAIEREILALAQPLPVSDFRIWIAAAAGLALMVGVGIGWHIARPSVPPAADARVLVHVEGQQADYRLLRGERLADVVQASEMLPGDWVRTGAGGGTTLVLSTGTRVAIAGHSDLQLRDSEHASQHFWLESGGIKATVAKLGPRERFLVRTPDSEIEAHGTIFSVKVGDAVDGGRTRVCLEEGVVLWRQAGRETKMIASNGHSVGCEGPTEGHVAPPLDRMSEPKIERPTGIAESKIHTWEAPAGASRPSLRSSLAEQNDLFAAAMGAERQGNLALAIAHMEMLLARFPDGSLAESAKVEVARLQHSKMPSATDF